MTTLDRLGIQGIRSYGPEPEQAITFSPPLTLILGPNGSGKTTIIESLRMATCGVLPPNSGSGQAFVHDPRVSHASSTETKGKIRLRFLTNGNKVTVSRLFTLTNKKGAKGGPEKQQYKQSDATLEIKGRDKKTITSKCAEIDKLTPELMCVSQAVLQNVIFCHQEESNWILGEPKVLKDKFDAIFASTRYSKALEQVKKTQTELKNTIQEYQKDEAAQKEIKKHAHEFKQTLRRCEHEKNESAQRKKELEQEIAESREKAKRCKEGLEKFNSARAKDKECNQKIEMYQEEKEKVEERVPQTFPDPPDELRKEADRLRKTLEDSATAKRRENQKIDQLKNEMEECNDRKRHNEDKHRKLQVQKDVMRTQEGERKRLAEKAADDFDLDRNLVPVPFERAPSTFFLELRNKYDTKRRDGDSRKKENNRALERIQEELSAAQQIEDREKQAIQHTQDLINGKTHDLTKLNNAIHALCFDEEEVTRHEEKVDAVKAKMQAELGGRGADQIQDEIDDRKVPLQRKTDALRQAKDDLRSRKSDRDKIVVVDDKKRDLETRKKDTENALVREPALEEVLGFKPGMRDLSTVTESVKKEIQLRRKKLEEEQQQHMMLKAEFEQQSHTLRETEAEGKQLKLKMSELIEEAKNVTARGEAVKGLQQAVEGAGETFENLIASLEKKIDKAQKSEKFCDAMKQVVDQFQSAARSRTECPLCKRALDSDAMKIFEKELKILVDDAESGCDVGTKTKSIEKHRAHIAALKDAQAKTIESGDIHAKSQAVGERADRLKDEIENVKRKVDDAAAAESRAQDCLHKAERVDEFLLRLDIAGIQALEKSIAADQAELTNNNIDESEIQNLENLHTSLEKEIEDLKTEIEKLTNEKARILGLSHELNKDLTAAKEKLSDLKHKRVSYDDNVKRKNEMERELQRLKDEVQEKKRRLPDLEAKKSECKAKQQQQRSAFEQDDRKSDHEINDLWQAMTRLKDLEEKIAELKTQKVDDQEKRLQAEIKKEQDALDTITEKYNDLKNQQQNSGHSVANDEKLLREIEDNLALQEYAEKIKDLQQEISERKDSLMDLPSEKELSDLYSKLQRGIEKSNNDLQYLEGVMQSKQEQINGITKKLEKEYADIDTKYKKTQIGIEIHKGAVKDLDKYYSALDKALMRFHEMKMEEINKYVREYWQTTYQGDDIEKIEIKADLENAPNRRSHNYRLVMHHRHLSELDMRGRCSAGQKVLASLVVRLALAETFCHNCGVLALDEPTSNLDERNIKGFTEALGRIVNDRRKAKNSGFQLIVISHDNEFIDELARATEVPEYFRISKDPSTQYSQIKCHDVTEF